MFVLSVGLEKSTLSQLCAKLSTGKCHRLCAIPHGVCYCPVSVQELGQQKVENWAANIHSYPLSTHHCVFQRRHTGFSPCTITLHCHAVHWPLQQTRQSTLLCSHSSLLIKKHQHRMVGLIFCNLHVFILYNSFPPLPSLHLLLSTSPSSSPQHCGNWSPEQATNTKAPHRKQLIPRCRPSIAHLHAHQKRHEFHWSVCVSRQAQRTEARSRRCVRPTSLCYVHILAQEKDGEQITASHQIVSFGNREQSSQN